MSITEICRFLSKYLLYFAAIILLPLGVAVLYDYVLEEPYFQTSATLAFLETIGVCLILSSITHFIGRNADKRHLYRKEGILFVVIIWIITTFISALPFQITGAIPKCVDAYYETMSGISTTGASILQAKVYDPHSGEEIPITMKNPLDLSVSYTFYGTVAPIKDKQTGAVLFEGVEALGKPLLFWRSFLQWLGGVGIVVLFISVLPALGVGGKFLYESEMPGLTKEGMTPHIRKTAEALWKIYIGLTLAQIILHIITEPSMTLFDAVTLSFSTISTGGFSVHNEGLQAYNVGIGWIMALFMFLGGISFSLYYHCLKRRFQYLKDPEFYCYVIFVFLGCLLLVGNLWIPRSFSFNEVFGDGPFAAISAITTTGFTLTSYDNWPMGAQFLLILLMYVAGMSGSAVGGIKIIRILVVFKIIFHKIESFFRPNVVRVIQIGHKDVHHKSQMAVFAFFCITLFLSVLGTYLLILDHVDPLTAFGTISAALTNAGLCFGGIGSTESVAFLSSFSKILSIFWMLLGRLEFFSILVLLLPNFWSDR